MASTAPLFVVVTGPPGSGKTTLATALAAEMRLPLFAKDTIKEVLMTVLPVPDVETSKKMGRAAIEIMFALAAACRVHLFIQCPDLGLHGGPVRGYDHR